MAKNKKAQILAAVMCAATVAGVSPAISSAAQYTDQISTATIENDSTGLCVSFEDGTKVAFRNDTAGTPGFNVKANQTIYGDLTISGKNHDLIIEEGSLTVGKGAFKVWHDGGVSMANGQFKVSKEGNLDIGDSKFTVDAATGAVTANNLKAVNGDVISTVNGNEYSLNQIGQKTTGIYSDGQGTTTIEGYTNITKDGIATNTVEANNLKAVNGDVTSTVNGNEYSLNQIGLKTTGIYSDGQGTTTIEGYTDITKDGVTTNTLSATDVNATNVNAVNGDVTSTVNGNVYSLNEIGRNTTGIYSDGQGTTTIQGYTDITEDGITTKSITADSLNVDSLNINGDLNLQKGKDVTVTTEDGNWYSLTRTGQKVEFIETEDTDGDGVIDTTNINGTKFKDGNMTTDNLVADTATINGNAFVNGEFNANNGQGAIISTNGDNIYVSTTKGHMNMTGENTVLGYGTSNVTFDGNGATFTNGNNGTTTINGGTITTDKLVVGGYDIGSIAGTATDVVDRVQGIEHGQYTDPNTGEVTGTYTKVEDVYISGSNINAGGFTVTDGNVNTTGDVVVGGDLTVVGTINGKDITDLATGADVAAAVGDTSKLTTTAKDNVVNAVNEVNGKVGDLKALDGDITARQEYKDNQSLVGAINAESAMRQELSGRVDNLDSRVGNLEDRMGDVEDRIDKVGAMAAAIANLRTMGYDPEAPTEIAVGVGQYESETGLALGVFHYPNQDFMLSASISTSGDEVMGGIGATWKIGRKSAAEKARSVEEKRVAKAEEMQEMAKAEKVKAQRERHAQMLAEREAAK